MAFSFLSSQEFDFISNGFRSANKFLANFTSGYFYVGDNTTNIKRGTISNLTITDTFDTGALVKSQIQDPSSGDIIVASGNYLRRYDSALTGLINEVDTGSQVQDLTMGESGKIYAWSGSSGHKISKFNLSDWNLDGDVTVSAIGDGLGTQCLIYKDGFLYTGVSGGINSSPSGARVYKIQTDQIIGSNATASIIDQYDFPSISERFIYMISSDNSGNIYITVSDIDETISKVAKVSTSTMDIVGSLLTIKSSGSGVEPGAITIDIPNNFGYAIPCETGTPGPQDVVQIDLSTMTISNTIQITGSEFLGVAPIDSGIAYFFDASFDYGPPFATVSKVQLAGASVFTPQGKLILINDSGDRVEFTVTGTSLNLTGTVL